MAESAAKPSSQKHGSEFKTLEGKMDQMQELMAKNFEQSSKQMETMGAQISQLSQKLQTTGDEIAQRILEALEVFQKSRKGKTATTEVPIPTTPPVIHTLSVDSTPPLSPTPNSLPQLQFGTATNIYSTSNIVAPAVDQNFKPNSIYQNPLASQPVTHTTLSPMDSLPEAVVRPLTIALTSPNINRIPHQTPPIGIGHPYTDPVSTVGTNIPIPPSILSQAYFNPQNPPSYSNTCNQTEQQFHAISYGQINCTTPYNHQHHSSPVNPAPMPYMVSQIHTPVNTPYTHPSTISEPWEEPYSLGYPALQIPRSHPYNTGIHTPIYQTLLHSDFSSPSLTDNSTVGECCSNKKEFPGVDEVIDKGPKRNGYTAYLNPKPPDDLECSVLSCLLTELIPVEVTKPAKLLSPETERILQRHTRSPLVSELVHHSQFWDSKKTVCEVKDIYKHINGQSLSHDTDSSEGERNWDCLPDVLTKLVAADEKGIYALSTLGGIFFYLKQAFLDETLLRFAKYEILPCSNVSNIARKPYMVLDAAALENLEMIRERQDAVAPLKGVNLPFALEWWKELSRLTDMERLHARILAGSEACGRNANKVVLYEDASKKQLQEFISALCDCELSTHVCSSFGLILDKVDARLLHHLITPGKGLPDVHSILKHFKDAFDWVDANDEEYDSAYKAVQEVVEIEELEEETCWSLTGVLKFLLVLGAWFLSTSYICSMNSSNPSSIQEAIWDFRHGFQKIQSNIFEVVTSSKFFNSGNQVIDERGEKTLMGLLAVNQRDMDEVVVVQNEPCENVFNDGWVSKLQVPAPMRGSETAASEVICDGEVVAEDSSSKQWGSDFTANEGVSDQEMDKIREGSNQLQGFGTAEKSESLRNVPIAIENEATSLNLKFKKEQMESEEQIKSQRVTVGEGDGKEVVVNESIKQILDHATTSGIADILCLCLAAAGSRLISGSSNLLRAAFEACRIPWSLNEAFELLSIRENAYLFPFDSLRTHSLLRLDIRNHDRGSLIGIESTKVVDAMTRAFLRSKAIQFVVYYCLRQHVEADLCVGVQLILRCCLHNGTVSSILCGLPSSLPVTTIVNGGGDGTMVSEIISILSLCASSNKDPQIGDTNNLKCEIVNASDLVLHSCLVLATIAQCLKSAGRNSPVFMLTSSSKKQLYQLYVLAHHFSSDDRMQKSFQPRCSSSMLTLASILSLETGVLEWYAFILAWNHERLCRLLESSSIPEDALGKNGAKLARSIQLLILGDKDFLKQEGIVRKEKLGIIILAVEVSGAIKRTVWEFLCFGPKHTVSPFQLEAAFVLPCYGTRVLF